MFRFDKSIFSQFDFISILLVIPLVLISNTLISEAIPALAQKQLTYVSVSIVVFFIVFFIPLRRYSWLIPLIYWVNIALLLAVEFFGHARLGAKRWIEIPFIHATIQPSEFVKPALILMLAYLIHKNPPPIGGYRLKDFLKMSAFILLPFLLIAKQPDLGTATVLLLIGFGILFYIGVHWKIWAVLITVLLIFAPIGYKFLLHDYQRTRIKDFLSEKPSYHVQQSIIAIGSGGLSGKPKEEATQTQMKFLPIATSDFIFAFLVERFGFLGALGVITLYMLLIFHLLSISYYNKDYYIKVITAAISFMIFIYMGVNISMTIGFAPVVGVPLPMFSYGGSSFLTFITLFAIMQNFITFKYRDEYEDRGKKSFL
ncbi:MAG: rod shape-determining protein RodA [Epsilonproteobacteria bacterium]|nr:rod shape-determining protein RodA [Campylobacterota bacterium]